MSWIAKTGILVLSIGACMEIILSARSRLMRSDKERTLGVGRFVGFRRGRPPPLR